MVLNFVSRTIIKRDICSILSLRNVTLKMAIFFQKRGKVTPLVFTVEIPENWQIIDENDSLDVGDVD